VATPKQIRELMKVDGLTNDEVKSHLQVGALHERDPCPS
jgi:SHAQKYF class myb-like DNA-binding protein